MARAFNDFLGSKPAYYAQDVLKRVGIHKPPVDPRLIADFLGYEIKEVAAADYPQFPNLRSILRDACAHLLRSINLIVVSRDMALVKRRSSTFHEIGHDILPWQEGLDFACTEASMDSLVKSAEREAFSAGAELLLLRNCFVDDAEGSRFGLAAVHGLAQRYQAPLESTAMRYASLSLRRCAILVVEPPPTRNPFPARLPTRSEAQIEFPFEFRRRRRPRTTRPPLAVKYFLKSARFPHFIFPHTPIAEDTVIYKSWKSGLCLPGEVPALALGVNNRHVSYKAECYPFGSNGNSKVLVLLSVEDHQLAFKLLVGGRP